MSGQSKAAQRKGEKRTLDLNSEDLRTKASKSSRKVASPAINPADHTDNLQSMECAVCFDSSAHTEGFSCPQKFGTFTCWGCMQQSYIMAAKPGAIQGGSNTCGELLCSGVKCRSPIKVLDLARSNATPGVIDAHKDFKLQVNTAKKVTEALRQQESQIRGEYARIEQIKDADEKAAMKLRLKIVDQALTMHCPRCKNVFMNFDGCFALQCANNNCRCGFCAWCLKDCGSDAHHHVAHCEENPRRGEGFYAEYFNSIAAFQNHHKTKRIKAVQRLLQEAALNQSTTEKLQALMQRDLGDLQIQLSDVFPDLAYAAPPKAATLKKSASVRRKNRVPQVQHIVNQRGARAPPHAARVPAAVAFHHARPRPRLRGRVARVVAASPPIAANIAVDPVRHPPARAHARVRAHVRVPRVRAALPPASDRVLRSAVPPAV